MLNTTFHATRKIGKFKYSTINESHIVAFHIAWSHPHSPTTADRAYAPSQVVGLPFHTTTPTHGPFRSSAYRSAGPDDTRQFDSPSRPRASEEPESGRSLLSLEGG